MSRKTQHPPSEQPDTASAKHDASKALTSRPRTTPSSPHPGHPGVSSHHPIPMSLPGAHARPTPKTVRLLLASLGNPAPHAATRHSAGHILLDSFGRHLSFPPFTRHKLTSGLLTSSPATYPVYTLFQCPTLMNVSGPAVLKAWRWFQDTISKDYSEGEVVTGLVLVHDELELPPGQVKLRKGDASSKGHNGVKSVQGSLRSGGEMTRMVSGKGEARFLRLGVGIGRPTSGSRDRGDVSEFVLGRLAGEERSRVEGAAGEMARVLGEVVERLSLGR